MRASLTILAVIVCLASASGTGNFTRIKRYLWMLLFSAVSFEWYLLYYTPEGWTYFFLYLWWTMPVIYTAWRVALESLDFLPSTLHRKTEIGSVIAGLAGAALIMPYDAISVLMALQGGALMAIGIQASIGALALTAVPVYKNFRGIAPYSTLGLMWIVQAVFCYVYAAGWQMAPEGWYWIGEWFPATAIAGGLLKLAWDFHSTASLPIHAKGG